MDYYGPTYTNYAAGLARAYSGDGYSDWYLPSIDELSKLYLNRVAIGGFTTNLYWSSSEAEFPNDYYSSRLINFIDGIVGETNKPAQLYIRAVRSF
jgi:hypothetical protein